MAVGYDTFPEWVAKVRKDPLGAYSYNRLLARFGWVEDYLAKEHLLEDGASVGTAGEHNASEIPREVGSVYITGGPTANKEGFRYATAATRTALGTVSLTLNPDCYLDPQVMSLQLQNCSEGGINKPCITQAIILSTGEIQFYSKTLSSALHTPGANVWTAEDANFCTAIHSVPLPVGMRAEQGLVKQKGNTLSDDVLDFNAQVQVDAELQAKFLAEHLSNGAHTNREVGKTWVDIGVSLGGGAYDILDTSARNPCVTATYGGTGIVTLTFHDAWALSAQPFVMPNYMRVNGGDPKDLYLVVTPRSGITTTEVTCYVYQYDFTMKTWDRADGDFFLVLNAGTP